MDQACNGIGKGALCRRDSEDGQDLGEETGPTGLTRLRKGPIFQKSQGMSEKQEATGDAPVRNTQCTGWDELFTPESDRNFKITHEAERPERTVVHETQ